MDSSKKIVADVTFVIMILHNILFLFYKPRLFRMDYT